MSFYIVREDSIYSVWNYQLNSWAMDVDAAYDYGFEYTTRKAANRRLKRLQRDDVDSVKVAIVTREALFADVVKLRDWSRPEPYAIDPAKWHGKAALELAQRPLF